MPRRTYRFDIISAQGQTLRTREHACFAARAPGYASDLLAKESKAAAVFAFECNGRATHAVYRS